MRLKTNWFVHVIGLLGVIVTAAGCGTTCPSGTTMCMTSGICANTTSDPANCGACGTVCTASQVCSMGKCALTCFGGTTACGGSCVNTMNDGSNCGACGTACTGGKVCSGGMCGLTCTGGTTLCGTSCANTMNDPNNCGACGTMCPSTTPVCSSGKCILQCGGDSSTLCGNECVNTKTDNANCGGCSMACLAGQVCQAGACSTVCASGQTACGSTCTNLQTDPTNCGVCGTTCKTGQSCVNGSCAVTCQTGLMVCNGTCVNQQTDNANCGSCGKTCAAGQVCGNGTCGLTCQTGYTICSGSCTNLQSDDANCGACATKCSAGQVCISGACSATCAMPLVVCSGACVDTRYDPANCGSCGTKCTSGQTCCGTGGCATLTTDAKNCGACGNACPSGAACIGGACTTGIIAAGAGRSWADGTFAANCYSYMNPPTGHTYTGVTGDGIYTIKIGSAAAFNVYCDMTDASGGWTQVLDQNLNVAPAYQTIANWNNGVNITTPNSGQYSILNQMGTLKHGTNYEFYIKWPTSPAAGSVQWTQVENPQTASQTPTISNLTETPAGQAGCGTFRGLAPSTGGQPAALHGDSSYGGCWWWGIGQSGTWGNGIPSYSSPAASGGNNGTPRAQLYVR